MRIEAIGKKLLLLRLVLLGWRFVIPGQSLFQSRKVASAPVQTILNVDDGWLEEKKRERQILISIRYAPEGSLNYRTE